MHAPADRSPASRLLVLLQFALIAVLAALAAPAFAGLRAPVAAWVVAAAGVALGTWAIGANRPGNFNIRPEPRAGGRLVTHGPYRWIRHPMYSALMLAAIAAAWGAGGAVAWTSVATLAVVLLAKSVIEEEGMLAAHPGYAGYRAGTRRFVPGLF